MKESYFTFSNDEQSSSTFVVTELMICHAFVITAIELNTLFNQSQISQWMLVIKLPSSDMNYRTKYAFKC